MRSSCSQVHRERRSSLLGSAPDRAEWVFLGLPKPWPSKVEKHQAVRTLADELERLGCRAKVAATTEPGIRVYQWREGRTRYLSASSPPEVARFLAGNTPATCQETFLVCSHGSRDPCCGQTGPGVIQALRAAGAVAVDCSHLGGHRFAPTVLAFPWFHCYGNLTPERVEEFLTRLRAGEAQPDFFRGPGYLERLLQVAHGTLWERTGRPPRELRTLSRGAGFLEVEADGAGYRIEVEEVAYREVASCRDIPDGETADLVDYRVGGLISLDRA
ncbi:MAG: sucrase ferredoxin [Candidatus Eremiobacterota bacterium]